MAEEATDRARQSARKAAETAEAGAEPGLRTAETLVRRYEELYAVSQENIEAMARAGNAVLQGTSELGNAWMSFWNDQASEGIRTLRALAECRTLQETLEIQNEFARTSLERLCANTTKTAELTAQMVNNGLGSVRARTQRTMQRAA
jgi:hypothetical protein